MRMLKLIGLCVSSKILITEVAAVVYYAAACFDKLGHYLRRYAVGQSCDDKIALFTDGLVGYIFCAYEFLIEDASVYRVDVRELLALECLGCQIYEFDSGMSEETVNDLCSHVTGTADDAYFNCIHLYINSVY